MSRSDLVNDAVATQASLPETAHSLDFHSVVWFGQRYEFTANQAACVAVLWQAWENRTPVVGGQTILVEAGLETPRLDIVFRKHPAWNTMIVRGDRRGNYRLAKPRCAKVKGKRRK